MALSVMQSPPPFIMYLFVTFITIRNKQNDTTASHGVRHTQLSHRHHSITSCRMHDFESSHLAWASSREAKCSDRCTRVNCLHHKHHDLRVVREDVEQKSEIQVVAHFTPNTRSPESDNRTRLATWAPQLRLGPPGCWRVCLALQCYTIYLIRDRHYRIGSRIVSRLLGCAGYSPSLKRHAEVYNLAHCSFEIETGVFAA